MTLSRIVLIKSTIFGEDLPIAGKRSLLFVNELNMIFHSGSGCKASATVVTNVRTLLFVDLKKQAN